MNPRKLLLLAGLLGTGLLAACDSGSSSSAPSGTETTGTNPGGGTPSESDYGIPWNSAETFGTMKDPRDGKTYRTVQIGAKTWMAQNLNHAVPGSKAYQDSEDSAAKYGRLYSWALAMSVPDSCTSLGCASQIGENHQGVCPEGWHVPTVQEWNSIRDIFPSQIDMGRALRSSKGWEAKSPSANGSDTLGMRILPAGMGQGLQWLWVGQAAAFWTPLEQGPGIVVVVRFTSDLGGGTGSKTFDYSVRCVKN